MILLGDGHPVADASPREVLAGGWYFATQVARVLGGAGGALTPEQGAKVLERVAVMTWIAGSFLVLGAVIVVGFAWYERTHPSTRVLALVATLAAMAALGRVAFAALPNVKPTTDIVLISGYVLGGAPGFMVGAIAALASNLFFGQGPWTPWQMVAWGGVGLFGAGLGRVFGHELGRIPLAVACGIAGLAFGAVMNISSWITFSGEQSTAQLIAYFGSSLPFDIAHATGNVVFCLAFGPALVRALRRFRTRFDIIWLPVEPVEDSPDAPPLLGASAAPHATHVLTCQRHASRARAARGTGGCTTSVGPIILQRTPRPMSRPEPYSACWTLADHVDRAAALWPDNEALVFGGVRRTFEQFADATFEFARALAALGVGEGDTVGVLLPIGIPALTALYGAARLGAIGVPLDPGLSSAQLRDVTRHADLKVLIAGPDVKKPDAPRSSTWSAGDRPAGAGGADAGRGRPPQAARGRALGHRADHRIRPPTRCAVPGSARRG